MYRIVGVGVAGESLPQSPDCLGSYLTENLPLPSYDH